MAYCSKCGGKLEEGDVYCPNCGSKIADIGNEGKNAVIMDNRFKVALNFLINMFLKPVTTAVKFIHEGKRDMTIVLTVIVVFIQGLLGMWRINQIISEINDIIIQIISKMMKILQLMYPSNTSYSMTNQDIDMIIQEINRIKASIKIPYGQVFLQNCMVIIVSVFTVFIIICLANTLLSRVKPENFKFYKTALVVIIPSLYFEFFSILFSYFSMNIGIVIMLFGIIASTVCLVKVVNESLAISENSTLFVVSLSVAITLVVAAVLFAKFMPSTTSTIVSSITDSIKNSNF